MPLTQRFGKLGSVAVNITFAPTFNARLLAEGKLRSISRDLVTEQTPAGTNSYYLARVSLTDAGMKTLGTRQMQPGMPAEVIIKTGERSLLTYVLSPLTKRIAASMKEE